MNTGVIVFIVVYAAALFAYFVTRVGKKLLPRAINKTILALMYLVFAIVVFQRNGFGGHYYVLMAALFLAFLGDLFLIFDFNRGGAIFLAANICFSTFYLASLEYNCVPFLNFFWVFIVWAALVATLATLFFKLPKVFKMGSKRIPMTSYLSSITLHGLLGLASLICIGGQAYILMGIGSLLFMTSDYILTVDRFVIQKNPWIVRSNSLTYFSGLLLIVLSLLF